MYDDSDMKIVGEYSAEEDSAEVTSRLLRQEQENGNLARARTLGHLLAQTLGKDEQPLTPGNRAVTVQRWLLLTFAVEVQLEKLLPTSIAAQTAFNKFYETMRTDAPAIYEELQNNGSLSFYYLCLQDGEHAEQKIGETFASLCGHAEDRDFASAGTQLYRSCVLQVEALCWCGRRATHNARVVDGVMVVEGEQVVVGDTEPDLRGYFGVNLSYKRWSLNTSFEYSFGGEMYNQTLVDRIENTSMNNSVNRVAYNMDRRALYDRWSEPGQSAKYRGINVSGKTYASSRFVQKNNYLRMNSIRIMYNLNSPDKRLLGMSMLRIALSANDLFYSSTIRQERGLSYPFARTFTLSLQANF